jgi:hypothetical protein
MRSSILWNVTPCNLVDIYQSFVEYHVIFTGQIFINNLYIFNNNNNHNNNKNKKGKDIPVAGLEVP